MVNLIRPDERNGGEQTHIGPILVLFEEDDTMTHATESKGAREAGESSANYKNIERQCCLCGCPDLCLL